jgi:hypothetical protein
VKHGLGGVELGDGWENTTSITGKEDNVGRVICRQAWNLGVLDVLDGVSTSSVFRQSRVIIINETGLRAEHNVLENRTKLDGTENIGLLLSRKANTFRVALNSSVSASSKKIWSNLHHPQC